MKFTSITSMALLLTIAAPKLSFAQEKAACHEQLSQNKDNSPAASFLLIGGLGTVLAFMSTPGIIVLTGPMAGIGLGGFISEIRPARLLKMINQAYDGDGKLLRKFYKKYSSLAQRENGKQQPALSYEEFIEAIKAADQDGSLCLSHSYGKKGVAEFIYGNSKLQ